MTETLSDNVLLNLQILVYKVGTVDAVRHDTTHKGSGKEYIFRLFFIEEFTDSHSIQQVKLFVRAAYQIGVSFILQILPDSRSHKSAVSCYIYLCILFHSIFY